MWNRPPRLRSASVKQQPFALSLSKGSMLTVAQGFDKLSPNGGAQPERGVVESERGLGAITQPWPASLPEQVRAVAQRLAASPMPLPLIAIEAAFKGNGPWKKGLPRILETLEALEALGRAQQDGGGAWRG